MWSAYCNQEKADAVMSLVEDFKVDRGMVIERGRVARRKVLPMCLQWGAFEVMRASVGERAEKSYDVRDDSEYWRGRLVGKGVTHIKFFGGTHVFDSSQPHFIVEFKGYYFVEGRQNKLRVDPFSNQFSKVFGRGRRSGDSAGVRCI